MRQLKFRVWSKAKQQWIENMTLLACIDGLPFAHLVETNTLDKSVKHHVYNLQGLEPTIQQFTGLLDSEGKEIYEGDIVELKGYCSLMGNPNICEIFEVQWIEHHCGFNIAKYSDANHRIIGNKMQNPELLKQ